MINIDPSGNVILEVLYPDGQKRLLVSSKVLTLVSPVFAAILKSSFREGLSHYPTSAVSIPLPDDDAEAFIVLCNTIHFRTNDVPEKLTLMCLVNLAIICDKYNCTSALAPWSAMWLQAKIDSLDAKDLHKLLFAAYILDNPDVFSRISWEILFIQIGPFVNLP